MDELCDRKTLSFLASVTGEQIINEFGDSVEEE